MTIAAYMVHVYEQGRYVRTIEKVFGRRAAYCFAKSFNAKQADVTPGLDTRCLPTWPQRAVVEAIEVQASPPERLPATDPLGPGMRPSRRVPAVV